MNIVSSGGRYQIYGDELRTYDKLPAGSYEVEFNPMSGFSLSSRTDLEVKEEKIYGDRYKKVEKALRSFEATDRNFGIILSGKKGIGKSLFAKMIATESTKRGYPVIVVSRAISGIAGFISSIDQEAVVIFDEFDKTFSNGRSDDDDDEGSSIQDELLPLFDGIDSGKKMFVITCNELYKISTYFKNRPGRFHYHFNLGNPSVDEIREYLTDKLKPEFYSQIDGVIRLSAVSDINYDILRALVFELNQGYSLEECLEDMNITREDDIRLKASVTLSDGSNYSGEFNVDIYDETDYTNTELIAPEPNEAGGRDYIRVCVPSTSVSVSDDGSLTVDKDRIALLLKSSYGNSGRRGDCYDDDKDMKDLSVIDISVKKIPRWSDDEVRRYIV